MRKRVVVNGVVRWVGESSHNTKPKIRARKNKTTQEIHRDIVSSLMRLKMYGGMSATLGEIAKETELHPETILRWIKKNGLDKFSKMQKYGKVRELRYYNYVDWMKNNAEVAKSTHSTSN